ncbi:STAS domain-containing protein [Methylogaea oryzae]|uniref:Anti-sigma factor antagonist n=1 Tax=Methylogaea oryzae TaxID=1295382 RepID=A0A8D4VNZ7_9GAMM|nr:STAS domain-containing protein [Methylogaea oryzae]BBL71403.1 hypothetical protein MoryE10_20090 [Methylogaea oryzae]
MQFESITLPNAVTQFILSGRLDPAGTQAIENSFAFASTAETANIIVDLSGVDFIASIGIRLLMTSARGQAKKGGKLVLASPQPLVRKVLETAGIDLLVPLYADIEAACADLAP